MMLGAILALVNPRAILQGDFMTLRFALAAQLERATALQSATPNPVSISALHTAEIMLDLRSVASLASAEASLDLPIRYRCRSGNIWLGPNAFSSEKATLLDSSPRALGTLSVQKNRRSDSDWLGR